MNSVNCRYVIYDCLVILVLTIESSFVVGLQINGSDMLAFNVGLAVECGSELFITSLLAYAAFSLTKLIKRVTG